MVAVATSAVDRFAAPLYTQEEAARYLGMPPSTLRSWTRRTTRIASELQESGTPLVTAFPSNRRAPSVPFVGLAEGYVLAAMRHAGVPLQRIRPALAALDREFGLPHALASRKLYTDGAEVLFDIAGEDVSPREGDSPELVVIRNGQRVFNEVVKSYLTRVTFADDGYAMALPLIGYEHAQVVADARRAFGQPVFRHGGARLEDALSLFRAGEPLTAVASEYGVPLTELEDAIRQALPRAA